MNKGTNSKSARWLLIGTAAEHLSKYEPNFPS
jgi:hypothetical protein